MDAINILLVHNDQNCGEGPALLQMHSLIMLMAERGRLQHFVPTNVFAPLTQEIHPHPSQLAAKKNQLGDPRVCFYSASLHLLFMFYPAFDCLSFHSVSTPAFLS